MSALEVPWATGNEPRQASGLTMIDVAWSDWGPVYTPRTAEQRSPARLASFLTPLVAVPGSWILVEPDTVTADRTIRGSGLAADDALLAPRRWFDAARRTLPVGPDTRPSHRDDGDRWRTGRDAVAAVTFVTDGLGRCEDISRSAAVHDRQRLVIAQMNLFRCRVYVGGEQVWSLFGATPPDPRVPVHVHLDLRFRTHLSSYWLHATLSASTLPPASRAHSPLAGDAPVADQLAPAELKRSSDAFAGVLGPRFHDAVEAAFLPRRTSVFGDEYRPPQMWVAHSATLGGGPDLSPDAPSTELCRLTERALRTADPRSLTVAQGVLDGRVRAFRRFLPAGKVPCYLLVPDVGSRATQEDAVRRVSLRLTNLETEAASELYDIATDVEMLEHLVETYEDVADRAGAFWDQLALHLPVASTGRRFRRPRSSAPTWTTRDLYQRIQLLQQVLVQGVADVQQLRTRAEYHGRRVEEWADKLRDVFDRTLTEHVSTPTESIRDALCSTGYVARTRRAAGRTTASATRISETYAALLSAVSSAFDERRVRETDQFQPLAVVITVAVVAMAFAAEGLGLAIERSIGTAWPAWALFVGVLIVAVGGIARPLYRAFGSIGQLDISADFAREYAQLRAYLDRTRTDRLRQVYEHQAEQERAISTSQEFDDLHLEHATQWQGTDTDLVGGLVTVLSGTYGHAPTVPKDDPDRGWRAVFNGLVRRFTGHPSVQRGPATPVDVAPSAPDPPVADPSPTDTSPADLGGEIERWAFFALLASERPRLFWEFGLPRLTFCYAFYPILPGATGKDGLLLVSRSDFELVLRNQCSGAAEHVEQVITWGRVQTLRATRDGMTAMEFVALLGLICPTSGMSPDERDCMLVRMAQDRERTWEQTRLLVNARPGPA